LASPNISRNFVSWAARAAFHAEKAAIAATNKAAMEDVVYIPTGFFYSYQAWRKNVTGIVGGPLPWFAGVKKT
jgi:peptide/nickel transport system substrate-binding protein